MSKKTWGIIVLLVIISFVLIINYNNNKVEKIEDQTERDQAIEDLVEKPKTTINVKHKYEDGTHSYVGFFDAPTPCHIYDTNVVEPTDDEEPYLIEITHEPNEDEICAQVITQREFDISFEAEEAVDVIASINDEIVNLNVFEVPNSQTIEEFEILNKG